MNQIRGTLCWSEVTSTLKLIECIITNEVGITPIDIYKRRLLTYIYNALKFERVYINMHCAHYTWNIIMCSECRELVHLLYQKVHISNLTSLNKLASLALGTHAPLETSK